MTERRRRNKETKNPADIGIEFCPKPQDLPLKTDTRNMSQAKNKRQPSNASSSENQDSMSEILKDMRTASNDTLLRTAEEIVRMKIAESQLLDDAAIEERIPKLHIHDLKLGRVVGRGAFCCVHEIRSFGSAMSIGTKHSGEDDRESITRMIRNPFSSYSSSSRRNADARDSSTTHSVGNESDHMSSFSGFARDDNHIIVETSKDFPLFDKNKKYVVKQLDKESMDKVKFLKGTVDLAMEARFLASLNHMNVIKLYGVSSDGPFADNFFLLLERMHETLTKRIKKWMDIERQSKGITGVFTGSKRKMRELISEQLLTAFEIAKGTSYLHDKKIIFRDLKPDNCGFNVSGVLKLFDFGLARELKESERLKDGTYKMTGFTGALRYSKWILVKLISPPSPQGGGQIVFCDFFVYIYTRASHVFSSISSNL